MFGLVGLTLLGVTLIYNASESVKAYRGRGWFGSTMAALTFIFALLAVFAIPAQIITNMANDKFNSIQLELDKQITSKQPDRQKIDRYTNDLDLLTHIGLLRAISFPDFFLTNVGKK